MVQPGADEGGAQQRRASCSRQPLGQLLRRLLAGVVPHEMSRSLHHDEAGVCQFVLWNRLAPASGAKGSSASPQQQRGDVHLAQAAFVGLQLCEVSRAVELQLASAALSRRRSTCSTRRSPRRPCRSTSSSAPGPSASRSMLSTISSPWPSVRRPSAMPCHFPSEKKPVSEMTSALTASGWSQAHRRPISPPQSWTTSATRSSPSSCRNASTPSTCLVHVPGGSGGESPKPARSGRDGAVAPGRDGGQRVPPHVGRLRIPVKHERHGAVRRPLFAVVQHGGEPTRLATFPPYRRRTRQSHRAAARPGGPAAAVRGRADEAPGGRAHCGRATAPRSPGRVRDRRDAGNEGSPLDGRGPRGRATGRTEPQKRRGAMGPDPWLLEPAARDRPGRERQSAATGAGDPPGAGVDH